MNVYDKERIIICTLQMLQTMRDEIRTSHDGIIVSQSYIYDICNMLMGIIESEKQDRKLVDIFEGLPGWGNADYIEPINYHANVKGNNQASREFSLR